VKCVAGISNQRMCSGEAHSETASSKGSATNEAKAGKRFMG